MVSCGKLDCSDENQLEKLVWKEVEELEINSHLSIADTYTSELKR